MNYLAWLLAFYAAAVAQTSIAPCLTVGLAAPDLLLLLAFVWIVRRPGWPGFIGAMTVGLAADLSSLGSLGTMVVCLGIAAVALDSWRPTLGLDHPLVAALATGIATMLVSFVTATLATIGEPGSRSLFALASQSVGVGLYTALLACPLLVVLAWMESVRRSADRRWAVG
jgi:rod shape-determining protein MreD